MILGKRNKCHDTTTTGNRNMADETLDLPAAVPDLPYLPLGQKRNESLSHPRNSKPKLSPRRHAGADDVLSQEAVRTGAVQAQPGSPHRLPERRCVRVVDDDDALFLGHCQPFRAQGAQHLHVGHQYTPERGKRET